MFILFILDLILVVFFKDGWGGIGKFSVLVFLLFNGIFVFIIVLSDKDVLVVCNFLGVFVLCFRVRGEFKEGIGLFNNWFLL